VKGGKLMFRKVIVATDPSESSSEVLNCLKALKSYGTEEILLLRTLGIRQSSSIGLSYESDGIESSFHSEKSLLENAGFSVKTRIITGSPAQEINKIAVEENYSMIAVGVKEETMLKQAFLGDLGYEIIRHSEKPVLLIRLGQVTEEDTRSSNYGIGDHILFPTDFSENSEIAFETVKNLVKSGAKKVTMIHVQDKSIVRDNLNEHISDFNKVDSGYLQTLKTILAESGNASVDMVIKSGSPSVEILNSIETLNIQLVVMGTHGRGFVKELFLGSVSNLIARHSEAPVLLVPAKRKRSYK
jgi:nucleotide-binding universal stress UspA family protein